jgi:hypothetical protein
VSYLKHRLESKLTPSKGRYKAFLRTLRLWRHLRMLKRGGRSYGTGGIDGTSPGELAVLCPACPIPSVNLPSNWESVGRDKESDSLLNRCISGSSIINHSASTLASVSKGGKYQTTRGIRSWVQDMHTLSHGTRIVNTSVVSPTNQRFVHPSLSRISLADVYDDR